MKVYLKSISDEGDCFTGEAILECFDYLGEKHFGLFDRDYIKRSMLEVALYNVIMSGDNPSKDIVEVVPQGGQFVARGNKLRVFRNQLAFCNEE